MWWVNWTTYDVTREYQSEGGKFSSLTRGRLSEHGCLYPWESLIFTVTIVTP
jgi:hypothetical protein